MAEIDTSAEAVRKKITDLRKDDARSWEDHRDSADLLEALLARTTAAEKGRDEARREIKEDADRKRRLCDERDDAFAEVAALRAKLAERHGKHLVYDKDRRGIMSGDEPLHIDIEDTPLA